MLISLSNGHCAVSSRFDSRISSRDIHPRRSFPLPPPILHRLLPRLFSLLPLPPAAGYLSKGCPMGVDGHTGNMVG
jgi:hypothetical protein